jgi:hypothetical protein
MKLAVGYPWSSPFMFTDFVDATLNLERPEGFEVKFFRGKGWCPAKRHIDLCEQALEWGANLICIIGSDQVHPPDMLVRLIERWKEGYEIIACLIPCRGFVSWQDMKPFQPMAWRFKTNDELGDTKYRSYTGMGTSSHLLHVINRDDGDEKGMTRCTFVGSGVIMFEKDHLLALEKPWFFETIDKQDQSRVACMDTKFAWRLQEEAGATIWVDTTIMVEHLHVFKIDDTYSERFSDWAEEGKGDKTICNF